MAINPFMNMQTNVIHTQPILDSNLNNKSQINLGFNTLINSSKNEVNNSILGQKNDSNPFKLKIEPNSNELKFNNNQKENVQNNRNSFLLLNNQSNKEVKSSTNININQNNNNNNILNINSINNNNNISQQSSNIFNNIKEVKNPLNNNQSTNTNILSSINKEIKKEEKKEEPNIFLSQSNSILNKSNNNIQNNLNQNKEQTKNSTFPEVPLLENKDRNISIPLPEKKENPRVNDFINNLLAEDKIIFTEEEKREFEKKQLSLKLNDEIINEFKFMLFTQKEKFKKFTKNSRLFENKFINLINNIKRNSEESLNNEIRYKNILEKIKLTEEKYSKLKLNMTNKDKSIKSGLDYLKKNLNNKNNFSIIKNKNYEEKNIFYKELDETSDKIRRIDKDLNAIWNSINKSEDNKSRINEIYNKEKQLFENNILNDKYMDGIFVERKSINNSINKIFVQQKDINNIYSECYEGLHGLKSMQDEFDIKYNSLKNKLIDKIKESNNNIERGNIQVQDMNI